MRGLWAAMFLPAMAATAASYPVTVQLSLAPKDQQQCLAPAGRPADCDVVRVVHEAFGETAARMFRSGPVPDLELVLRVRSAEVAQTTGLEIALGTRVTVRTPGGRVIDEIDSSALVPLLADEPGAIAIALRQAAADAAHEFEEGYRGDRRVADYLAGAEVAPPAAVAAQERSDRLVTLGAGLGVLHGGDTSMTVAPSLRIGLGWGWFFGQLGYEYYEPSFSGVRPGASGSGDAGMSSNDFGVDLGWLYRFTQTAELRAGPGLHAVWGDASLGKTSEAYSKVVPTVFASVTKSFAPFSGGQRLVIGVEARAYFFSSVPVTGLFRAAVPAANASLGATFGVEFPWPGEKAVRR